MRVAKYTFLRVICVRSIETPMISFYRYIVGSKTASALEDWRWALRVTPVLGLIAVILIYFLREPERGQHEGHQGRRTSYKEDLIGKSIHTKYHQINALIECVSIN